MDKQIWDYIQSYTKNEFGTAALMGNLMAESSLNPKCVTGIKDPDYISKSDSGTNNFVHDGHAFGLAQWCFYTRKEGLLNLAKSKGKSVGDLNLQLSYLIDELSNKYKTVWLAIVNAVNIRTCSDVIMAKYERPANMSEVMKQRRAEYGFQFYSRFAGGKSSKYVVVTADRVNIRLGNGKGFARISQANSGSSYEWVATSENGWHAVKLPKQVGWISGEFSKVE